MNCCICGVGLHTENAQHYFCKKCWHEWKDSILSKEPWITCCINDERRQRRRALEDKVLIYLGSEYEVAEVNGGYKIVPTKDHFEEVDQMTLEELKELIQQLGFNDNCKVVLLVGKVGDDEYQIVKVDSDGKLVTTT